MCRNRSKRPSNNQHIPPNKPMEHFRTLRNFQKPSTPPKMLYVFQFFSEFQSIFINFPSLFPWFFSPVPGSTTRTTCRPHRPSLSRRPAGRRTRSCLRGPGRWRGRCRGKWRSYKSLWQRRVNLANKLSIFSLGIRFQHISTHSMAYGFRRAGHQALGREFYQGRARFAGGSGYDVPWALMKSRSSMIRIPQEMKCNSLV